MAGPGRIAVAGRAAPVRGVADLVRAVPAVAARRDLAADPVRAVGPPGLITWDVSVDSAIARAHQHAAGARKGDLQKEPPGGVAAEPGDHALGRSRGGRTTKVHLSCEQDQKPLSIVVTAGQRGDSPQFAAVIEAIRVPRPGPGRPRTRPDRVLADKAYSSKGTRAYLRRRGIRATIPVKADQAANRRRLGRKGGRPGLRPRALQAAPRRGMRHQPPQAQPRRSHPLRQARRPLPDVTIAAINEWLLPDV